MTRDYILGAALGIGVAATGFYLYKKNQDKIDILRSHGMDIPVNENKPLEAMSIEELAMLREKIEDMIAERELAASTAEAETAAEGAKPKAKRRRRAAKKAKPAEEAQA